MGYTYSWFPETDFADSMTFHPLHASNTFERIAKNLSAEFCSKFKIWCCWSSQFLPILKHFDVHTEPLQWTITSLVGEGC